MRTLNRTWQLTGFAMLTVALAAAATAAGTPAATARAVLTPPVINRHALVSWGDNQTGDLGDGSTTGRSLYGSVEELGSGVVQVAAGQFFTLALRSDGTVWAWGANALGQMGNGTTSEAQLTPVQVSGLTGTVAVSAGYDHALALRSDGTVWVWGGNRFGQLGNGSFADQTSPVEVAGLTGVTQIAAGTSFSLALRSDGTVLGWGNNDGGNLGDGTVGNEDSGPVQVSGLTTASQIAAGVYASYAIYLPPLVFEAKGQQR